MRLYLFVGVLGSVFCQSIAGLQPDIVKFASYLLPTSTEIGNQECRKHSLQVIDAFKNLETWAIKMLDSTAKLPSGLLEGNTKHYGHYDECLESVEHGASGSPDFVGQYCMVDLKINPQPAASMKSKKLFVMATNGRSELENMDNMPFPTASPILTPDLSRILMGICVPSSCNSEDVELAVSSMMQKLFLPMSFNATAKVPPQFCYVQKYNPWMTSEILFILTSAILCVLVIMGTILDLQMPQDESNRTEIGSFRKSLLAFSLPGNWNRFLSTTPLPAGSYECMEGMRVLSTIWVIIGHRVLYLPQMPWINPKEILNHSQSLLYMVFINNMPSVDTFLLMSGFLRATSLFRDFKTKNFTYFGDLIRRYFRLTPAFAFVMFFYATVWERFGRGPEWNKFVDGQSTPCQINWLYNLLYIGNYVPDNRYCLGQGWYLAADMHYFILAPLLVYPLWRWPKFAYRILLTAVLIASSGVLFYTVLYDVSPTVCLNDSNNRIQFYIYMVHSISQFRVSSYIVGIALAYIMFSINDNKSVLTKTQALVGWALSLLTVNAVIFSPYGIFQASSNERPIQSALYAAFHRPIWATAVGWMLFASHKGWGGWANRFLSAKIFLPISRISYCIFLTHYGLMATRNGLLRNSNYMTALHVTHDIMGDGLLVLVISTTLHLLVEAPILELIKIWLRKERAKGKPLADRNNELPLDNENAQFGNNAETSPKMNGSLHNGTKTNGSCTNGDVHLKHNGKVKTG